MEMKENNTQQEELKAEISRLNKKISELKQDLIHANENVFYREMAVKLDKEKIKAEAIIEFAFKLKVKALEEAEVEDYVFYLVDSLLRKYNLLPPLKDKNLAPGVDPEKKGE